jgi:hypothetical protein
MFRVDSSVQPFIAASAPSAASAMTNTFTVFMSVSLVVAIPIANGIRVEIEKPLGCRARPMPGAGG